MPHLSCRSDALSAPTLGGEPLVQQAIDALREYHQAQDRGAPAEEIERLRLLVESLFQVVSDYQRRVVAKARGKDLPPLH